MKNTSEKNSLGLTNSQYSELFSEGGPIETYRSIFMKNTSEKNSLGLTNSRYSELFSGSLQSSLYRDSTVVSTSNSMHNATLLTIVPQLSKCLKFEAALGVITDQMI